MFEDYEGEYKCNIEENFISYEPCKESTGLISIKDTKNNLIIKYNNKDIKKCVKKPSNEMKNAISNLNIENFIKILGILSNDDVSITSVYLNYRKKILIFFYIKKNDTCVYKSI